MAPMIASGVASSIANSAAFRVPIDSGTMLNFASKASSAEEDCQMKSGAARPSYQTRPQSALIEVCGCGLSIFRTRIVPRSSLVTRARPLFGPIAMRTMGLSATGSIFRVTLDVA
jgi:hypothetical protein